MNDRINELASKCWVTDRHTLDTTFNETKFAELIIKECISVCNSRVGGSDYNTGRLHCISDIKDHFGV